VYSGVQNILFSVVALFFFHLCTLCYQFLWIVHFWLKKNTTQYVLDTTMRKQTQYVLDTTMRKQTQTTQVRHVSSYKQREVSTNLLENYYTPIL
jgi:hypothetical protein